MKALLTLMGACLALAACAGSSGAVDVRPIGKGLEFLGLALVFSALILVFAGSVGAGRTDGFTPYVAPIMVGLFGLLTVSIAIAALPQLVIPLLGLLVLVAGVIWWVKFR